MVEPQTLPPPQAAAKLNDEGKFAEAKALLSDMVEKGEKSPPAFLQMARALRGLKDLEAARSVEERALALFPQNVNVKLQVANALSSDRNFDRALNLLSPLLEEGKTDAPLFVGASIALRGLARGDEAEMLELRGLETHPEQPGLVRRRAIVLSQNKRFRELIDLFDGKEALARQPWAGALLDEAKKALADQPGTVEADEDDTDPGAMLARVATVPTEPQRVEPVPSQTIEAAPLSPYATETASPARPTTSVPSYTPGARSGSPENSTSSPMRTSSSGARPSPSQTERPRPTPSLEPAYVERRSGSRGFVMFLIGLLVLIAAAYGAHVAGFIDLTPIFDSVSKLVQAAR
ncbi:MAG: hypothetical protein R3D44_08465 [Hyphomicrobiaceae bacterium]